MISKVINFNATDGIVLDGIINKCENNTDKILIQIHGMTSNCFKKREKVIANKISRLNIDKKYCSSQKAKINK